jgi:beta-phosphoglucomutase-like phosphatase (HAD superfamily)
MKKYDCVIWDWNGTLLDDIGLALSVVNEVLLEYGVANSQYSSLQADFRFPGAALL